MFKGQGQSWLYFIGIILMFAILLFASFNFLIPFLRGNLSLQSNYVSLSRPSFNIDVTQDYLAEVVTNKGRFIIDLYERNAPNNVNNFIYLSQEGFYNGTTFHRIVPSLLIQGGDGNSKDNDLNNDGLGNPGYLIDDEINFDSLGLSPERKSALNNEGYASNSSVISAPIQSYSIAMASAGPNTNGSQFFIIVASNDDKRLAEMNGKFTVIGDVIEGRPVVRDISNVPVDNPNLVTPKPNEKIIIERIQIYTR